MTAAVLTRPVQPSTHTCEVCRGAGGLFRGGRFPESCPNGCPPRIVQVGGCLECGCSAAACSSGCGCTCCCSYLPAVTS